MSPFLTFYEEETFPFTLFHEIWHAALATANTLQQIDLVAVEHIDAHNLTNETCQKLGFWTREDSPFLFRILYAVDHNDAINQLGQLLEKMQEKHDFLEEALEQIDGFPSVEQFDLFITLRDGSCPYTMAELEAWLRDDGEEKENKEK